MMDPQTFISTLQEYPVLLAAFLDHASGEELVELSRFLPPPDSSITPPWEFEQTTQGVSALHLVSNDNVQNDKPPMETTTDNERQALTIEAGSLTIEAGSLLPSLIFTWRDLKRHAMAAPEMTRVWSEHLNMNLGSRSLSTEGQAAPNLLSNQHEEIDTEAAQALCERIAIVPVTDLGSDVFSLTLAGPVRTTFVYSMAALKETTELEHEFLLYHQFAHYLLPGHLPSREFGLRTEFRRGRTPDQLLTNAEYLQTEWEADDIASCVLYSEYIEHELLSVLSAQAVRGALLHGASVKFIRRLIKERAKAPGRLIQLLSGPVFMPRTVQCISVRREALPDVGSLLLVKGRDRQIYVVVRGSDGTAWKQWVCSRRVLSRLGWNQSPRPKVLTDRELAAYPELRPLLDPDEVDDLRVARICWLSRLTDLTPENRQYPEEELQELLGTLAESIVKRTERVPAEIGA